jgi:hypothetical protein
MNSIELAVILSGKKPPEVITNLSEPKRCTFPTTNIVHWEYPTGFGDLKKVVEKISRTKPESNRAFLLPDLFF